MTDFFALTAGELEVLSAAELQAALAVALSAMTAETFDVDVIAAYLRALEKKDPMPSFSQLPLRYPSKRSDIP